MNHEVEEKAKHMHEELKQVEEKLLATERAYAVALSEVNKAVMVLGAAAEEHGIIRAQHYRLKSYLNACKLIKDLTQ